MSLDLTTNPVPIVTIQPLGSNGFYSTMALNEPWKDVHGEEVKGVAKDMKIVKKEHVLRIAHLRSPKTRITSLVPASPTLKVVRRAMMRMGEVTCVCVPDEMTLSAAISFAGNETPLSHAQHNH